MKKIMTFGLVLVLSLFFVIPVSAKEEIDTSDNIPVYYEEPDWSDPDLPAIFIVVSDEVTQNLSRAYLEELVTSYGCFRETMGGIQIYNQKYSTFRFLNSYVQTTQYTLIKAYPNGKEYLATVSYKFN